MHALRRIISPARKRAQTPAPALGPLACASLLLLPLLFTPPALAHEVAGPAVCEPLPALQTWLDRHAALWDTLLRNEPGYERPSGVRVCRQPGEWPFADNHAGRVYVRRLQTRDDAVTLAHEYVHLAFQHYPSGHDETYVEQTARRLIAAYP